MNKKIKSILCGIVISSTFMTSLPVFASDLNSNQNTEKIETTNGKTERGIGSPAQWEYTVKSGTLTKADLDALKAAADKAQNQNTSASLLSFALKTTSHFFPSAYAGLQVAGTVAKLTKSDLKPYATVSYCYDRLSYIYDNPGYKAKGQVRYQRHFNGFQYDMNWSPYDAPVHLGYTK